MSKFYVLQREHPVVRFQWSDSSGQIPVVRFQWSDNGGASDTRGAYISIPIIFSSCTPTT